MKKLNFKNIDFLKLIAKALAIASFLIPVAAIAGGTLPQPDCQKLGLSCDTVPGGQQPVTDLVIRVINIALGLAFLIAVIFLIYGGFVYVFSAGNEDKAKTGRNTVVNALIGITIIVLSYVIVQIVARAVSGLGNTASI